ncbi:hypothetical protein ACWCV9_28160 [Streptomyces sp. NPDC001606]
MRLPSRAVTLLAVAAMPFALSACSGGSSSGTGASAGKGKAKTAAAAPLTGTQLKKALAPASSFPAGFTMASDGAVDSGSQLQDQAARKTGKPDCTRLEGTSWIQVTGFQGGRSFAQNDYSNKAKTETLAQEIDAFDGTTAQSVMKAVQSVATQCATFTDTDAHAKINVTSKATAGLGDEAYTLTEKSAAWQNGTTLIAARSGKTVVTVLSTAGSDNGAASAKKLATGILASLKKIEGAKSA